jgi:outer membrane receptor protein involved in Fe transport
LFEESIYTDFDNQSVEYVPSLVLTYDLKNMNSIQLGYSNRIQRPGIWYLNPYVDDTNPKYIRYGNPDLTPEYVHSFYTNVYFFTKLGSVNFGGYYDITVDGIGPVYTLIDVDIIHETYDNNLKKNNIRF